MYHVIGILIFMLVSTASSAAGRTVNVSWLEKNLSDKNTLIIDISDDLQHRRFHIPGAIHLPYEAINTTRKQNRASISIGKKNIVRLLGMLGVSRDTRVVIYDDMGGLHAGRLYWELNRLAHPDFALLDGGLVSWILAGNKVTNKLSRPVATTYSLPASVTMDEKDDMTATAADIKKKQFAQIMDVRTTEEYVGTKKNPRSGHIPGAINWAWDNAIDIDKGFRLRNADTLLNELKQLGFDKDKPTLVYCHSGHRASQTFYTLQSLGFKNVKLYDESMKGYEHDKSLPLIKGNIP